MPAVRRIYNKARSAKLYKEDTLNSLYKSELLLNLFLLFLQYLLACFVVVVAAE